MATGKVARRTAVGDIGALLESPEVAALVSELDALRWTGRKDYPIRSLVGACLAKSLYAIPTWTSDCLADRGARRIAGGSRWLPERLCLLPLRDEAPKAQAALGRLPRPRDGRTPGGASPLRRGHRHRRLRPGGLRERPALPLKARPRAGALLRPGRLLGTPLRRSPREARRRLLRVQTPLGRHVRPHRSAGRLDGEDGEDA